MAENPIFSYTKRDYESSRKEGYAKIPTLSKGTWTDMNATDPGIIILDYVHALVDMINYYQDHQALETFISTAKERANIFRIAKQLAYDIQSAKGARCSVVFDSPVIYDRTIKIPKYSELSTTTGIPYLTAEDAYLLAGEHVVSILCTQGSRRSIDYEGTGISRYSQILGAKNQEILIADENVDIESIEIIDSVGRSWRPVESIVFSTPEDRVYEIELNYNDSILIKFGDGERGRIPQETDNLTIYYISTKANEGGIAANTISSLDSAISSPSGGIAPFIVYNPKPSTGGSKSQTSREIRELAPGVIKSQDRAVTIRDFEYLAKMVDGVADAKAYDINNRPELLFHEVKVVITPTDPKGDTSILSSKVYDYLYKRMIPPTNLTVVSPSSQRVNIDISIVKLSEEYTDGYITYLVQDAIEKYFDERSGAIEEPFYPTDLSTTISKLEGVRYVSSITPNSVVLAGDLSVITLGSISIEIS